MFVAWSRVLDRISSLEFAAGNTFEHQPGAMLRLAGLHFGCAPKACPSPAQSAQAPRDSDPAAMLE